MLGGTNPVHKVIISGTGRSGTSFLVHLLTELGLDTGIDAGNWSEKYFEHSNAGLEHNLLDPKTPYIVKNPALCETLPAALASGRFIIDHAYIPIRSLEEVAASRADVGASCGDVSGGLWHTSDPSSQRAVLASLFHRLIHTILSHDIPLTFILFPRMIHEPAYLYDRLAFLMGRIPRGRFDAAFDRVADPSLVHHFGAGAPKVKRAEVRQRRRSPLSMFFSWRLSAKPSH